MPSVWRKTGGAWVKIKTIYRKTGGSWQSVRRVWRKTGGAWQLVFLQSITPSIAQQVGITLAVANTTTQTRKITGTLYRWSDSTGITYQFTKSTNDITYSNITGASGTSTNPAVGSSNTNDTYTLTQSDLTANTTNYFKYISKATNSTYGTEQTSSSDYVSFEMPRDVTISVDSTATTGSSIKITWTATTGSGSYIVYYGTASSPTTSFTTTTSTNATVTGLTSDTTYYFRVLPYTGSSGNGYYGNYSNEVSAKTKAVYKFVFGNELHVSTNGYIGLGTTGSSDSIPTTGKFLAVIARDLYQLNTDSVWYWSDSSKYTIRWEGYDYGSSGNTKVYQATFYKDQSYADVLAITVTGGAGSTSAYVEDGTTVSTYAAALTTGQGRRVYFDGTTTATVAVTEQAKTTMKKVSGLTSGTQDQGYTTLVTAVDQNGFSAGTFKVTGGSTETASGYVSRGATLTVTTASWPANTTFSYQWYRSRDIEGLGPLTSVTTASTSSTVIGEYLYCVVKYSNTDFGLSNVTAGTTYSYTIVPAAPTYTLTNNSNGTFTISSVASTGATGYYGTWKLGTGSDNAIASSTSPTAIATNTTPTSGAGTVSVSLYASVNISYQSGLYSTRYSSWEKTDKTVDVTSAATTPTVSSISYIPLGNFGTQYTTTSAANTSVGYAGFTGSIDDGYWQFNLPFTLRYNGTDYTSIYVGTNSYVTLGGGSNAFSNFSATNPAFNKVLIYAGDRGSNSVYWYWGGGTNFSTATVWNIKLNAGSSTSAGTAIQWEAYSNKSTDPISTTNNTGSKSLDITIVAGSGGTTGAYTADTLLSSLGGNGTAWRIKSQ